MPLQKINDTNYYYELHGQGKPIVFIAGFTCDHQVWQAIYPAFTPQYQVLLFDNRGVGQTQDKGEPLTAQIMAKDTCDLIQALGLEKPHIVGQSMGGTIAQMLAVHHPEVVDHVVIVNSVAKWSTVMLKSEQSFVRMREENIDLDLICDITFPWIFGNEFLEQPQNIATFKQILSTDPYLQSVTDMQRQYKVLEQFDSRGLLAKIAAPALVVISEEDIIAFPHESTALAQGIKNAKITRIPGGHVSTVEQPAILIQAILQFLQAAAS